MRNTSALLLVICSVATTLALAQQGQQQAASPVVTLNLSATRLTVKLGAPIKVAVVMTNQSNRRITFNVSVRGNYQFDVSDSQGPIERRTPRIDTSDFRLGTPELRVTTAIATLEPGQARSEEINVSELFSFHHVGTYRIQAIHPDPVSNEPVASNPISITIVP